MLLNNTPRKQKRISLQDQVESKFNAKDTLYVKASETRFQSYLEEVSENPIRSPGTFTLYIWNHRTRCFIPLYMHIRISAGCISNLILSVGASRRQAALRVFSEIQLVPLRVFPTFFPPPRHRVHSEKYIRREKERGRKKRQAGSSRCARGAF